MATITDADSDNLADAGETITYSITVTNTGNVRMSDIEVSERLRFHSLRGL